MVIACHLLARCGSADTYSSHPLTPMPSTKQVMGGGCYNGPHVKEALYRVSWDLGRIPPPQLSILGPSTPRTGTSS